MLNRKILNILITIMFILAFTFSMTVFLYSQDSQGSQGSQKYSTSYNSSYDYVALGDSYSAGHTPYGVTVGYSYTDIIRDKLENAGVLGNYSKKGVSGYTTIDVMGQLLYIKELLYYAEIVTMDIGINDILYLSEIETYRSNPSDKNFDAAQAAAIQKIPEVSSNIREIINEIKAANPYSDPQIYIMGYFNAYPNLPALLPLIEKLNDAISDITVETGVTYVETMAAMDEKLQEYLPGDIHPTVLGYTAIAEEFWKFINEDLMNGSFQHTLPKDIQGHWAENIIKKYLERKIITGYEDGCFRPDNAITRGEFVTIINKYFNLTAATDIDFIDVPNNAWYKSEVQKAVKAGYVSGYNDNSFRADKYVTREEAAVMTARILKFDLPEKSNEALINAVIRHGILKGYPDNSMRYQGSLTRAEVLSMLDNISDSIIGK